MNLPVEVLEGVRENRAILFLGSRASLEAAVEAGQHPCEERDLARELGWRPPKQLMGGKKQLIIPSVARAAEAWTATHGRESMLRELSGRRAFPQVAPTRAHEVALKRFPIVFSTAWDDILLRAGQGLALAPTVLARGASLTGLPAGPVVVRQRGSFDAPETVLVSRADYEARPWPAATRKEMRELMRSKVIFFVGYRPDEEEFELLWEDLTDAYGGELPRCHLAVGQGRIDDFLWQKWVWRGLLLFTADPMEALEELDHQLGA